MSTQEQNPTVPINGYEEEERGWAVYDETHDHWVAVYACTHEDWANDAEDRNEAPSLDHAEELVNSGAADDNEFFLTGSREEVINAIRRHRATDADKLMRNMLALLDAVVAGEQLYDPHTVDEQESRDALLEDYAKLRGQLSVAFAHPLDTTQDVRAFLILTEDWAL